MEKNEKKEVRRRGRPAKPKDEKYVVTAISLPPDLEVFARVDLGEGSISKGVQKALIEERKRQKKTKK